MKTILWVITSVIAVFFVTAGLAATYSCNSCSGCTSAISGAVADDIVELTVDIASAGGSSCIDFGSKSNITLDGKGFTVRNDGTTYIGIYLSSSANTGNTVRNIAVHGFKNYGIYIVEGSSNHLEACSLVGNGSGIDLYSASDNTIENSLITQNFIGLNLRYNSDRNIIRNSSFIRNYEVGVNFFPESSVGDPEENQVYNNIFNNYGATDVKIQLNSSEEERDLSEISFIMNASLSCDQGANIMGCGCVGGNYWQGPAETGYSETCADIDGNGICDSGYTIGHATADLTDAYPLTIPATGCCATPDRDGDGYLAAVCGGQDHDDDPLGCGADCYLGADEVCDNYDNDGDGEVDRSVSCDDKIFYSAGVLPRVVADQACVDIPGSGIYCFGGRSYSNPKYLDTITLYDPESETVRQPAATLPGPRSDLACSYAPATGKAYCFGGYWQETICTAWDEYGGCIAAYSIGHWLNEITVFDPVDETVSLSSAVLPVQLEGIASVWNAQTGTIFLFGGTSSINAGNRDMIMEFDPVAQTIITRPAVLPSARYGLSCAPHSATGTIFCFGGRDAAGGLAEIVAYTPATDTVYTMTSALPEAIRGTSCVEDSVEHLIYCLGGGGTTTSTRYRETILVYDGETDQLGEKNGRLFPGRFGHQCVEQAATSRIFCFGGSRNVVNLRDVIEYIPYLPIMGDVNDDGRLDLADVVLSAKTVSGQNTTGIQRKADSDGDWKIGLPDTLFQLRKNVSE